MSILKDTLNLHILKSVYDTPATAIAAYAARNEVDLVDTPPKGDEFGFEPLETAIYDALVKSEEYLYADAALIVKMNEYRLMEVGDNDEETYYTFGMTLGVANSALRDDCSHDEIATFGYDNARDYGSVIYFSHDGRRYVVCVF